MIIVNKINTDSSFSLYKSDSYSTMGDFWMWGEPLHFVTHKALHFTIRFVTHKALHFTSIIIIMKEEAAL